jgi:hypothetical protein
LTTATSLIGSREVAFIAMDTVVPWIAAEAGARTRVVSRPYAVHVADGAMRWRTTHRDAGDANVVIVLISTVVTSCSALDRRQPTAGLLSGCSERLGNVPVRCNQFFDS